ncbi:TauD/TfdA family dioxygenase [Kribbella catacumbae]|uniref:TauD/TfdA family dioxygenase n=1 Tax=Kribbella catacumbae TaxID=460086 RepID=UPI00035E9D86|nr:TauD/TfdA family dioxygenase [Kribbella catacumbae]
MSTDRTLPHVIDGGSAGPDIVERFTADGAQIRTLLAEHGAVLLRNCRVGGVEGMEAAVRALSGEPLKYAERSSPRRSIKGNVYTSTDYPPTEEIFLHNENSYQAGWPRLLFFYCDQAPQTQGATPLADIRRVYDAIDRGVREEFARRKWMVERNFHEDFGVAWQHVFNTENRAEVEAYCAQNDLKFEWIGDGGLRTRAVREPIHVHPGTGETVWFNHITFFHNTTLPASIREGLLAFLGEDELPTNTYYGDGGQIPDDVMDHLRSVYRKEWTRFDWQQDDLLLVDNMLAAHAREPFTGDRKIAVAMAEAYRPVPAGV